MKYYSYLQFAFARSNELLILNRTEGHETVEVVSGIPPQPPTTSSGQTHLNPSFPWLGMVCLMFPPVCSMLIPPTCRVTALVGVNSFVPLRNDIGKFPFLG